MNLIAVEENGEKGEGPQEDGMMIYDV